MLVAFYKSNHKKDPFPASLGYAFIKLGQIGEAFSEFTHCEAIFEGDKEKVRMGSASVRDGYEVRITEAQLNPEHWVILDVPSKSAEESELWFLQNVKTTYSMIGAMASATWIVRIFLHLFQIKATELGQWCSRAVPESMQIKGSENMNVSEFMTVLVNLPGTRDVTAEFFGDGVSSSV